MSRSLLNIDPLFYLSSFPNPTMPADGSAGIVGVMECLKREVEKTALERLQLLQQALTAVCHIAPSGLKIASVPRVGNAAWMIGKIQ